MTATRRAKSSSGKPKVFSGRLVAEWAKYDNERPTDWRWGRAATLLRLGGYPDRWDGPWVRAAWEYQRLMGSRRPRAATVKYPHIHAAERIYRTTRLLRWELESRILARQPFDEIAAKTDQLLPVVEAYEALFFCVLDRITDTRYIIWRVIGDPYSFDPADPGKLWRFLAYHAGTVVLDGLISHFCGIGHNDYCCLYDRRLAGVQRYPSHRVMDRAIAAFCVPISSENVLDAGLAYVTMRQADLAARHGDPEADELREEAMWRLGVLTRNASDEDRPLGKPRQSPHHATGAQPKE